MASNPRKGVTFTKEETALLEHAEKATNFNEYVKALIARDMEGDKSSRKVYVAREAKPPKLNKGIVGTPRLS